MCSNAYWPKSACPNAEATPADARLSSYTAGMVRVAVALLAILGILLVSAGIMVALAVGLPALGLNPYGRNPLDQTIAGLAIATTLYVVGAALLASAIRWMRTHIRPVNLGAFAFAGAIIPVARRVDGPARLLEQHSPAAVVHGRPLRPDRTWRSTLGQAADRSPSFLSQEHRADLVGELDAPSRETDGAVVFG